MSNNPTPTLTRPVIPFCLASKTFTEEVDGRTVTEEAICTRLDEHGGHCCDEVLGRSWHDAGTPFTCGEGYDHRVEKGLSDDEDERP